MPFNPLAITLPMRYVHDMLEAAKAQGMSATQVLAWSGGLKADRLNAPGARVSLQEFSRLYGALSQRLDDECAGLSSCRVPLGALEAMTRSGSTTSTFIECAEVITRVLNATIHQLGFSFSHSAADIQISISEREPIHARRQSTYEVILLPAYATMAWLLGKRLPLLSADFPGPEPAYAAELRTLFAGPLRFNQARAALRFGAELGTLPVLRRPSDIAKHLKRAPSSLVEALVTSGLLTLDVRQAIKEALPALVTLNEVALILSLSPRSLHRKLQDEGESFQKVKDELRRDLAIHALTRTQTPIKRIAADLGFSDQPSFQRAFAQWTGRPPGRWRRTV